MTTDAPFTLLRPFPDALGRLRQLTTAVRGAITSVQTATPAAALTFDDGPHPIFTPRLLDLLARHRASATFFLVGEAAAQHPALVQEITRRGHVIGNHSWSHPSFTRITRNERRDELRRCRAALGARPAGLFRPPYGHHDRAVRLDAARCGLTTVGWSLDVHDWCEDNEDVLADALERGLAPGSIVLLHDAIHDQGTPTHGLALPGTAHLDRSAMLTALDAVLTRHRMRLDFVTLPTLLASGVPRVVA